MELGKPHQWGGEGSVLVGRNRWAMGGALATKQYAVQLGFWVGPDEGDGPSPSNRHTHEARSEIRMARAGGGAVQR
jgi:hypothetical protein